MCREECPIEERPQTFRDVYPKPDYLPPDIELSDVTLFTLSTQWAQLMYNEVEISTYTNRLTSYSSVQLGNLILQLSC